MTKLTQDELAFLSALDLGADNLKVLELDGTLSVKPEVLISWVRRAFTRGKRARPDGFVWHDVAELVDMRNGL